MVPLIRLVHGSAIPPFCLASLFTFLQHFGEPTAEERRVFTRVLQGHIAIDTAVFPTGTTGKYWSSCWVVLRLPWLLLGYVMSVSCLSWFCHNVHLRPAILGREEHYGLTGLVCISLRCNPSSLTPLPDYR